ncbi:MAG TPA: NYN domain-containing protein [Chloroflexota bacterium]|nr:NYN domain-containing protein [Chloroflexota bacterium]
MVEFGATLARLRLQTKLSTVALARAVNLDPSAIERYERNEARAPDRQLVLDLAHAMNLTDAQTDELLWSANHLPHRVPALDTRDAHNVALFVDHENVYIALSDMLKTFHPDAQAAERRKVETAAIAHALRSAAEEIGWVKVALAIADWERLPPGQVREYLKLRYQIGYNLPGRNNADLKLSDAMRDVLEHDENNDVDTYILVTGDGGYLAVVDTLLQRQKQVYVWGVRGATNAVLQQNATNTAWVDEILGVSPSRPPNGRMDNDIRVSETVANGHDLISDSIRTGFAPTIGNDVSRLEALAIHLNRHLRQRSWSYITFVRFLGFLSEVGVFGPSREEQLAWLSHAKETGVLREEIMDDPTDPTRIARRFRLDASHPLVGRALAISARVGTIVPSNGRGVAFGVVIDRLIGDPDLSLTDVQAKNWLTWFTENGYLVAEPVPHFRKEGVTVTLLRQNPGYWETETVVEIPRDRERPDLVAEATVIRLVNFLERHPHFAWMALSQLLNQMTDARASLSVEAAALNRQRSKSAIALAQEKGLIIVEQIPNLKTGGTTTVARLNRESERVTELLNLREALVRRLGELLVSRPSVSRGMFQLTIVEKLGLPSEEAGAWIDLLIEEGLFTLDAEHDGPAGSLRVDHRDLIVSRILFRALPGTLGEAERA